jgi:flavin-dependent dehydrogenase
MPANAEAGSAAAQTSETFDVVVLGGGMAGLAAAIHLRRRGLRVVCIEPDRFPHARVGESLDWSSPGLLARLGVPGDSLIADRCATYKKSIQIVSNDRPAYHAQPEPWFQNRPIGFNTVTLHVDRVEMDRRLFEQATELGAEFVWERVARVETEGDRVVAAVTSGGQRIEAPWFLDASGRMAQLLLRTFHIPKLEYGREKVCFWTYFDSPPLCEGTTFYADTATDEYLTWIWEIPISPQTVSIGCIMPAAHVAERRRQGSSVAGILTDQLLRFPRFRPLIEQRPDLEVRTAAYRSYVAERACGPNWLILGEAASLPDPLTANGVTAAFRHAEDSVAFLADSFTRGELTARQRWIYDTNLKRMGHAFNHSIEGAIYDWPIRWGLGVMPAQKVYTAFSYTINALYSKFRPKGWASMLIFGFIIGGVRLWIDCWSLLGRISVRAGYHRAPAAPPQATAG